MDSGFMFFVNSALFGVGLAMDAFSVSLANGLNEPKMKKPKMCLVSGVFALFQTAMPLLGWVCVHTVVNIFTSFQKFIPFIALGLLLYIGIGMFRDGIKNKNDSDAAVGLGKLLVQGIATSIDALSVGFTISELGFTDALTEAVIIGAVTFIICFAGLVIGKKFGTKLAGKASIFGGVILIGIGIEIFVTSLIK